MCSEEPSVAEHHVETLLESHKALSSEDEKELLRLLYFDQIDARLWSLRKAQAKTCKWLLATPQYRQWINAEKSPEANWPNYGGFFWIKGKPGTGKSVMMKFLFSEAKRTIRSTKKLLISFFFNARGSELEMSTLGLYRSLLLQLFDAAPETKSALGHLGSLGSQAIKRSGWNHEVLKETFALALDRLRDRGLCCYIDALDECPEGDIRDMISFFEDLGTRERSSFFQVCLSSRHYPEIGIKTTLQLVLENEQDHTEDIRLYIDSQLNIGNSLQAEEIKAEILRKSSSIFLWAFLVIPMLNKEYDRGRIKGSERRLNEIPIGLHKLFIDILKRDCENMDELCLCVQLILFAKRPLRPEELRAATTLVAKGEPEEAGSVTSDDLRKFILDASKGLAEITKSKKPTVQFIHESVRDFLLKEGGMKNVPMVGENVEGQSHNNLVKACTLQLETCHQYRETRESAQYIYTGEELTAIFPFLEYATLHIFYHANFAERFRVSQQELIRTFRLEEWKEVHRRFERFETRRYDNNIHLLYILAENGAESLIRTHPERSQHFQIKGGRFNLPLIASIFGGHNAAARALVGCDLPEKSPFDKGDSNKPRAIGIADYNKPHRDVISYLGQCGDLSLLHHVLENRDYKQTSFQPKRRSSLLMYAASEEVVDLLFKFSSDLSLFDEDISLGTIHHISDTRESQHQTHDNLRFIQQAVQCSPSLLTKPVWSSRTLLQYACWKRFWNLFKYAISELVSQETNRALHGNEVCDDLAQSGLQQRHAKGTQWPTIFLHAAKHDEAVDGEKIFGPLLSKHANEVNQTDDNGSTALHLFARHDSTRTELLLNAGADVNAADSDGETPLLLAIKGGSWNNFSLLLHNPDCEVNCTNKMGRGALHSCVLSPMWPSNGPHGLVKAASQLLTLEKFEPNTRDNQGRTAIDLAVAKCDFKLVKVLLESHKTRFTQQDSKDSGPSTLLRIAGLEHLGILGREENLLETVRVLLMSGKMERRAVAKTLLVRLAERKGLGEMRKLMEKYVDGGDISESFLPHFYDETEFPDGPNGKFRPSRRV